MAFEGFGKSFFAFFKDLAANNEKAWFEANRDRYENDVRAPMKAFVEDIAPKLAKISPNFIADPKKSSFRIHRDVRFSKDKSPYKTNAGIHLRHQRGKDAHAPGYYLHLEPGTVFCGGGVWKPAPEALLAIRTAIAEQPKAWRKALSGKTFSETFGDLREGDPLSRPPKGFDGDHEMIDYLKRRSFFAMKDYSARDAATADFVDEAAKTFAAAAPVMRFMTEAVGVEF